MLFNSPVFAVFFIIVFSLYWLLRRSYRIQNVLLLAASYFFYGWWDVRFLVLIVISTVVDYGCALSIQKGRLSSVQRLRASVFVVVATFCFLGVNGRALDFATSGWRPRLVVDWAHFLTAETAHWWIVLGVVLATGLVNLVYPFMVRLRSRRRETLFLVLSILANLTMLGFFKYFNFFTDTFQTMAESLFGVAPAVWFLNVALPVGISFYTFQTMSYTIDVYRREMTANESLLEVAAYVSFFPQLVAGPIERGRHLLPQFHKRRIVSGADFREGTWLIFWGLYKKMVVADNMALIVDRAFEPFSTIGSAFSVPDDGMRLLVAVYAFAFQIYCDFSGYTDIARGTARLLGFDIMLNFNLPYLARNPSEFWRRWHISLSTWLRDYLYIPLGGNRHGAFNTYRNLILTMLLGGLWHGAAWTFVLWGALQGLWGLARIFPARVQIPLRSTEPGAAPVNQTKRGRRSICMAPGLAFLQWLVMFHLVCLGWLIFRAQNMATIGIFLRSIFFRPHWSPEALASLRSLVFYGWFLVLFQVVQAWTGDLQPQKRWPWIVRLNVWAFVVMSLLGLAAFGGHEFIYFAF